MRSGAMRMKPLILTSLHGLELEKSDLADVVVAFTFKFAWENCRLQKNLRPI
jgi:hypothetical protein